MQQSGVQIGEILLGKYSVERVLGLGGMGIVVAARHTQLNELFAIKMMLPDTVGHEGAALRFVREAQACARLKGEHIARVHDVGTLENGAPYMVMEYLAGDDLSRILQGRGALSVDETATYMSQTCEAIAEAHAAGIIHRDLKPSNLFLTRRPNGTPSVKVLDFGISKELDPANQLGSNLTKTGMSFGTPMYMSPEQMANSKAADIRSDIWSLGVILYELVTGAMPFEATLMTELVTKVLVENPRPPSQVRPGIPPAFDAVVMKCLDKRPGHRYQSAQDLMRDLSPFVTADRQHSPTWTHDTMLDVKAQTNSDWSATRKLPPRNDKTRILVVSGVLGLIALLGVAVAFASRGGPDKPTENAIQDAIPTASPTTKKDDSEAKDPVPAATKEELAAIVEPLAPVSTVNPQPLSSAKRINGSTPKSNSTTAATNGTTTKNRVLLVPR